MHGIFDSANNQHGMVQLRSIIARIVNAYVHNVELCSDHGSSTKLSDCSSEDLDNSLLMPVENPIALNPSLNWELALTTRANWSTWSSRGMSKLLSKSSDEQSESFVDGPWSEQSSTLCT